MTTLLVLSVGSLVGTNVLDAVADFRPGLRVVGINSEAAAPNNFRCDRVWLAPPASDAQAYWHCVEQVLQAEQPALVLAGRDDDIGLMAAWRERHPRWARCLAAGPSALAAPMTDKQLGHDWALARDLPFAPTVSASAPEAAAVCARWRAEFDGALIAKPARGDGSRDVRLLLDDAALQDALGEAGLVIQPYLGDAAPYRALAQSGAGTPLFWTPALTQFVAQAVIGPEGEILGRMDMQARMVAGRCERAERLHDPAFTALGDRFARAFAGEGWRGSVNAQFVHHPRLGYRAIEFCARIAGGAYPRLLLGFDELALTLRAWTGNAFERPRAAAPAEVVLRVTQDVALNRGHADQLRAHGTWAAPG
jgi:hypothetical protein